MWTGLVFNLCLFLLPLAAATGIFVINRDHLYAYESSEANARAIVDRVEKLNASLIQDAPPALLAELRRSTVALHETLAAHEVALNAVKVISEGLVHAMAEEVVRQRGSGANYSAKGALDMHGAPSPTVLDRNA